MSKLCPEKVRKLPPKTKIFLFFLEKINFFKMFLSTKIDLIWQASRKSCRSNSKITSGAIIFAPNVKLLSKKRVEGTAHFPKKLSSFWQSKSWRKGRKFATASQLSCRNWPSHISSQKNQREEKLSLGTWVCFCLLANYNGSRRKIENNAAFLSSVLIVTHDRRLFAPDCDWLRTIFQ